MFQKIEFFISRSPIILWVILFSCNTSLKRNCKIDDSSNYLSYPFQYIDTNYQIRISPDTFGYVMRRYGFAKSAITTYSDSLKVVLMAELNDWEKMRKAHLQITYTWDRVSKHLWIPIEELMINNDYKHPYEIMYAIRQCHESKVISKLLSKSRDTLKEVFPEMNFAKMRDDSLIHFAFTNHPDNVLARMIK